jgi:hypothetical protein
MVMKSCFYYYATRYSLLKIKSRFGMAYRLNINLQERAKQETSLKLVASKHVFKVEDKPSKIHIWLT